MNIYGIAITGAVGIGVGIAIKLYSDNLKRKEAHRKEQVEILSKGVEIKVDQDIVDEAVKTTVDRVVTHEVKQACNSAVFKVKADIHQEIRAAVDRVYSDIESDVRKEIDSQVRNLDISGAKKEVIRKAKERVAEKFEENLDDVLDKFNTDLNNVTKIYSSIAKSVSKDDKTVALKID